MLPENLEGILLENNLKIIRRLGEGGMGIVYEGIQPDLGRSVCVKFLRSELVSNYEHFKRFQREVRVMSTLTPVGIARIYSIGSFMGVYPYIVMELVEGSTLRALMSNRKLNPEEVCKLFILICRSLSTVHKQGFVHRDLKPENIMVQETGDMLEVKILDFGLCGLLQGRDESVTQTEELLGSLFYMAPECFISAQYSPTVDIYALGCMIYEILAEAPPFCPREIGLFARLHNHERFPKLAENKLDSTHLIPALQLVLEKACAKNPAARYQTTEELAVSLETVLSARSSAPRSNTPGFAPVFLALTAILLSFLLLREHSPSPLPPAATLEKCQSPADKLAYFRQFLNSCHSRKEMDCDWALYQTAFEAVLDDEITNGGLQKAFAFTSDVFSWTIKRTNADSLICQCVCISRAECALALGLYVESERCLRVLRPTKYPKQLDTPRWVRANLILARALARQNKGEEAAKLLNTCISKLCVSGVEVQKRTSLWNASTGAFVLEPGTRVQTPEAVSPFAEGQLRLALGEILLDLKRPEEAKLQLNALRSKKWHPTDWSSAATSYSDYYKKQWLWAGMEHLELNAVYYRLSNDDRYPNCLAQAIQEARSRNLIIDEARLNNRFRRSFGGHYRDPFAVFNSVPPLEWERGTLIKSPSIAQIDEALSYLENVRAPINLISNLRLRKAQRLIKENDFPKAKQIAQAVAAADKSCAKEAGTIIHHCDLKLQEK